MATVEQSSILQRKITAADSPVQQPAIGRMGPWQLTRLIHESELARVYLARSAEASLAQPASYAVKALRKEWWRDPQAIEMQRRAAWLGSTVSHPHLLPVLASNVQQAPYYFVSPRLSGHSLATLLKHQQRLPLPVILWIGRQIAEALAALHGAVKMLHADVKPSNIIVSSQGHATLIDLGFAYTPTEARHWSNRPVVGTFNYIAPEAVTSSLAAQPSSDLYSLGVTLYEMIIGQVPFAARTPEELVRMHREAKPVCVRHIVPELPKPVASLVHRLLSKDPLRRPSCAEDVAAELTRLEISSFSIR